MSPITSSTLADFYTAPASTLLRKLAQRIAQTTPCDKACSYHMPVFKETQVALMRHKIVSNA